MDQMRTLVELKQKQLDALKVRAGIDGVLVDLPLQVGQHVSPGNHAGESRAAESPDGGAEDRRNAGAGRADRASRRRSIRITESFPERSCVWIPPCRTAPSPWT